MGQQPSAVNLSPNDSGLLHAVEGEITFARTSPDEPGEDEFYGSYNIAMVPHRLMIRDARPLTDKLSLDREGFVLMRHGLPPLEELDPKFLGELHEERMIPLIKSFFNASDVIPRRRASIVRWSGGRTGGMLNTAAGAHTDYAPGTAPGLAALEDEVQGLPPRSYSRMMVIQTWLPLTPAPQDFPLAFCDGSTFSEADLSICEGLSDSGVVVKASRLHFRDSHRWYYFQNMTPDELILFKGYDSDNRYNVTPPHAAFDNRAAFPNAHPRRSIESRFFVYFD